MGDRIYIAPGTYLLLAIMVLVLPIKWMIGALGAALFHELSHLVMIFLTGAKLNRVKISLLGAEIRISQLGRGQDILCAMAGPAGSLLLASLAKRVIPEMAVCAFVQGLFNLLPVYPLDGGRVIRRLASEATAKAIQMLTLILLWGMGIWACLRLNLGKLPLFPALAATRTVIPRKIPCKEPKLAVQ